MPRTIAKNDASARATWSARSAGTGRPACSRRTFSRAAAIACEAIVRCSAGRLASRASSPAFIFSQIRGTAKNQLGFTCGR